MLLIEAILVLTIIAYKYNLCESYHMENVIVGLNAALQRRMIFQEILSGDVNRAQSASVGIGGKGQDVLLATSCMELVDKKKTGLLQFIGSGCEGDTLLSMLEHLLPGCLHPSPQLLTVRTKGRCRTCITLIEEKSKHHSTELIEPSPAILQEEETALLDLVSTSYGTRKVGAIAFMGSLPPNVSKDIYGTIITRSCDSSSKVINLSMFWLVVYSHCLPNVIQVILDTVVGLLEAITACHLIGCVAIVKVNASFVQSTFLTFVYTDQRFRAGEACWI